MMRQRSEALLEPMMIAKADLVTTLNLLYIFFNFEENPDVGYVRIQT